MNKIIIYDFEVFKYDTLLGVIVVDEAGKHVRQMWDKEEIKKFYNLHSEDWWIGHNNLTYDNGILDAIINDKDPFVRSKSIINNSSQFRKKYYCGLNCFDLMLNPFSLKLSELAAGKKMYTTEVDFNLDRHLTEQEKEETNMYNLHDLEQTLFNFNEMQGVFRLRLNIVREFDLPVSLINSTEAKIAGTVLKCKNIDGIENMYIKPELPSTLRLKNKDVIDFYLSEGFRNNKKLTVNICGCEQHLGSGGIHGAIRKASLDRCLYFDVSGYYNLIMINYNLLPRTVPEEGKKLYEYMYHQQLKLKKTNPELRWVYKTILLAVFGASMNKYTLFYDPQVGSLITIIGQLFLCDLLEKLEESGLCVCIQSNTDGLMISPNDWKDKDKIIAIVEEWEQRTGFVIKKEEIFNLRQRDVNNYIYEKDGSFDCKGEALKAYRMNVNTTTLDKAWEIKEAPIIGQSLGAYLLYGTSPEEYIEKNKYELRKFQQFAKKLSYDYCTYEWTDLTDNSEHKEEIGPYNRVFASKSKEKLGMVYKYKKNSKGQLAKTKVACLPDNVFICNDDIVEDETTKQFVYDNIDYDYYVRRTYERILEFMEDKNIEDETA